MSQHKDPIETLPKELRMTINRLPYVDSVATVPHNNYDMAINLSIAHFDFTEHGSPIENVGTSIEAVRTKLGNGKLVAYVDFD